MLSIQDLDSLNNSDGIPELPIKGKLEEFYISYKSKKNYWRFVE